jgi:Zn finger protein HypA/HybF involved in hydrogenase expression
MARKYCLTVFLIEHKILKGGNKMKEVTAYCVKCKKKEVMDKPEEVTMKNGRKASKGICPKCGTKMFKIGG